GRVQALLEPSRLPPGLFGEDPLAGEDAVELPEERGRRAEVTSSDEAGEELTQDLQDRDQALRRAILEAVEEGVEDVEAQIAGPLALELRLEGLQLGVVEEVECLAELVGLEEPGG